MKCLIDILHIWNFSLFLGRNIPYSRLSNRGTCTLNYFHIFTHLYAPNRFYVHLIFCRKVFNLYNNCILYAEKSNLKSVHKYSSVLHNFTFSNFSVPISWCQMRLISWKLLKNYSNKLLVQNTKSLNKIIPRNFS